MKIKNIHFDTIKERLSHLKHIDFSLFLETIPEKQEDLSSINIIVLAEPNEYFGLHDWVIQNKNLFQIWIKKTVY